MQLSPGYNQSIQREVAKGFWRLPKEINTFRIVQEVFQEIKVLEDFTHFRRNFPPEWTYIPAIRMRDKKTWEIMFWWVYEYHKNYDESFFIRLHEKDIQTKDDFWKYMDLLYETIIDRWLPYDPEFDMSVTFSNESVSEVIKKYCSNEAIEKCNNPLSIHPTERRWTINKVLFYRATPENKYTEKMFDDYTEWRNSKRVAQDFIRYFYCIE
jgi:hypothetical protein